MNPPPHNSNQNAATPSAVQQVNPVINQQQPCNGNGNIGGLFPNNRPMGPPPCFMNFPNQPFPMQNTPPGQFPNGITGFDPQQQNFNSFPVNQFMNPSQQQGQIQGQFFPNNSMNRPVYNQNVGLPLPNQQAIMQNTIQNICQLLQLQNSNYAAQCPPPVGFPMFQNHQMPANVMNHHQNMGFIPNQQFSMPNYCNPLQQLVPNMGQQLQGTPFLPHSSGPVQVQNHQIAPQNPSSFVPNQMVGNMQHNANIQGQQRPLMDHNASRQGTSHLPQNPTNFQDKNGNMPANVNVKGGSRNNFTGDKNNDASHSHRGFKSQFHHAKTKLGYNGNMNRAEGKNNASGPRNPTNFEKKKVPTLKYTDEEIKQWREARKKHYPTNINHQNSNEHDTSILRRQQLKEILAKQAELGCEVADVPSHYLSGGSSQNQLTEKHQKQFPTEKHRFNNKRQTPFQNDRITKKKRPHHNPNKTNDPVRDPSLLQKLLTRDIKRDQNHLLQVFRFMAVNSFFSGGPTDKCLRFPRVIVGPDVADCSVVGEGGDVAGDVESEEEEGQITD
ncbi:hypothetical protein LXL04_036958 [Taraxacum kok-saghyz]